MINVAIVEDHENELQGIKHDLERAADIAVVVTAATVAEAINELPKHAVDVAIVDLELPDGKGHSVITQLRNRMPQTSFIVLSGYEEYDRIYAAILAGAVGYLGKVYVGDTLVQCVRDVHAGGSPISSPIARKVLQAFQAAVKPQLPIGKLTTREQEILHILASGRSYQDIADTMFISVETVRTHVRNLYKKLQVHSWRELGTDRLYDPESGR